MHYKNKEKVNFCWRVFGTELCVWKDKEVGRRVDETEIELLLLTTKSHQNTA